MQYRSRFLRFVITLHSGLLLLLSTFNTYAQERFTTDSHNNLQLSCSRFIPGNTQAVGSLRLCHSRQEHKKLYSCQTLVSKAGNYRIYFKGGQQPAVIASLTDNNQLDKILWQNKPTAEQPVCNLPAPPGIPTDSQFLGAGVCQDINDQPIPCTVFRHKAFRTRTYSDYMTFYDPHGAGARETKIIYTGNNRDAMPAELEFQIGLSLIETHCCRERGLKYMKHAHTLFPSAPLYRITYQYYKAQILGQGLRQLSAIHH